MNDYGIISNDLKLSNSLFVAYNGYGNTGIKVIEKFCELIPYSDHKISTILTNVLNKQTRQVDGVNSKMFHQYEYRIPEISNLILLKE